MFKELNGESYVVDPADTFADRLLDHQARGKTIRENAQRGWLFIIAATATTTAFIITGLLATGWLSAAGWLSALASGISTIFVGAWFLLDGSYDCQAQQLKKRIEKKAVIQLDSEFLKKFEALLDKNEVRRFATESYSIIFDDYSIITEVNQDFLEGLGEDSEYCERSLVPHLQPVVERIKEQQRQMQKAREIPRNILLHELDGK